MRILALSSWWPEPADNGIRLRIAHLLRELARYHELHLLALSQGPIEAEQRARLTEFCASVEAVPERRWTPRRGEIIASLWRSEPSSVRATWNQAFANLVSERAAAVQPDLVLAFELTVAPYARRVPGVPRVLDDLEMARLYDEFASATHPRRRFRAWLTWRKHSSYVMQVLRDFDACTVVSASEQTQARKLITAGQPLVIIPNGADVVGCSGDWGAPEADTLIYPGAISYDANFDAVAYFLGAIWPQVKANRPHARLRITGQSSAERRAALPAAQGVEFTGFVPDVRPLVARSWLEVVPLRLGSGTRLKVLEALALGTPVVTSSKGVEGLDLEHGRHLFIADTPADFAATTTLLLSQPALRARLAAMGRQAVRERYDWQVIGARLNDLICETAKRKGYRHVSWAA